MLCGVTKSWTWLSIYMTYTSFLINIQAHNVSQALTGPKYSEKGSQPPVNRRRIPSPPLALLIVMLPKAHLILHSRMSGSRWAITPWWFSGSWRSFSYSSSEYSYHLFLISSASVRSIPFLSFIELIFAWNVPLEPLIFLKRSLVFSILLFSSISLHWSQRKCNHSLLILLLYSYFTPLIFLSFHNVSNG